VRDSHPANVGKFQEINTVKRLVFPEIL